MDSSLVCLSANEQERTERTEKVTPSESPQKINRGLLGFRGGMQDHLLCSACILIRAIREIRGCPRWSPYRLSNVI